LRGKMDCFAALAMTAQAMDASRSLSSGAHSRELLAGDDGGGCGVPPLTLLRHCERSEAIHSFFARRDGLLRFARNDGRGDGLLRSQ
jgi:hypothetical protein